MYHVSYRDNFTVIKNFLAIMPSPSQIKYFYISGLWKSATYLLCFGKNNSWSRQDLWLQNFRQLRPQVLCASAP